MTKSMFQLGLVLAVCAAMMGCKKPEESAEKADEAAAEAMDKADEAAEAAGAAAEAAAVGSAAAAGRGRVKRETSPTRTDLENVVP